MQAVVFAGTREVADQDVPDADLEEPSEVLLRGTASAIAAPTCSCTTGAPAPPPAGARPRAARRGRAGRPRRRDGQCRGTGWSSRPTGLRRVPELRARLSAACPRVRPGGFGAAYGYAGKGP